MDRGRADRLVLLIAVFIFVFDAELWMTGIGAGLLGYQPAWDFTEHRFAAVRFLTTGTPYWPWEAQPFDVWGQAREAILYPPTILLLMVPFVWLPWPFFWGIPIGLTAWVVWRHRTPARLIAVGALCVCPLTMTVVWYGNPSMWIVAVLALAVEWPGFAPLVLVKPSLFPFALYRIHRRGWWVGLGFLIVASVPFAGLWLDWLRALLNSRQEAGLLYSVWSIPPLLIPLTIAGPSAHFGWLRWLQRRQRTIRINARSLSRAATPGPAAPRARPR